MSNLKGGIKEFLSESRVDRFELELLSAVSIPKGGLKHFPSESGVDRFIWRCHRRYAGGPNDHHSGSNSFLLQLGAEKYAEIYHAVGPEARRSNPP